jgi:hypothetical protein
LAENVGEKLSELSVSEGVSLAEGEGVSLAGSTQTTSVVVMGTTTVVVAVMGIPRSSNMTLPAASRS